MAVSLSRYEIPHRVRRVFRDLRDEHSEPARDAAAIGLGLFVGSSPFYGLHLPICWGLAWLFRVNRLKAAVASTFSIPLIAPGLLLIELQAGAWLRHGSPQRLTLDAVRAAGLRNMSLDLLTGSVVVGSCLGLSGAAITYGILRFSSRSRDYDGGERT